MVKAYLPMISSVRPSCNEAASIVKATNIVLDNDYPTGAMGLILMNEATDQPPI